MESVKKFDFSNTIGTLLNFALVRFVTNDPLFIPQTKSITLNDCKMGAVHIPKEAKEVMIDQSAMEELDLSETSNLKSLECYRSAVKYNKFS